MEVVTTSAARTTANMGHITPDQYSKSNLAHFNINTRAVDNFVSFHPTLGPQDRLLDFGCGTGETTIAMAQGVLGGLGTPGEVVGVDISEKMVSHCRGVLETSPVPGLSFHQLDVTKPESFLANNMKSFSCLTSFSCLHWVPNMPAAVTVFNKVLKVGGKFVFVIPTTTGVRRFRFVYEEMKKEERWRQLLSETSWMYYNTVNVDNDWMTNVDKKTGYGNIQVEDFVKLVENLGFRVDNVKTVGLDYKISEELVKGFVDAAHQNVWPEITGLERKEFFAEFIGRAEKLKSMDNPDSDGFYNVCTDGFQIMGEKLQDHF